MQKILSIVIPTHNRAKYAVYSILSILEMNLSLELIISDTSSDATLFEFFENLDPAIYPNTDIVYRYNKELFDMAGNHNYALSLATGKYVCLIGDDDTVSPFIISACDWMEQQQVSVISQLVSVNYIWPDFKTKFFGTAHAGRLYIDKNLMSLEKVSCSAAFKHAMDNSAQGTDGLPKLYHGIVRKSLLDAIKDSSGNYVHGASPDFSAAIALSQFSESFYQTTFPLTIPGASGGSNTGRSALNKHKGSLANESQTKNNQSTWEKLIPPFFSVETVWADACFKTLRSINCDFETEFNFFNFYSLLFINHRDQRTEIFNCMNYYASLNGLSNSRKNILFTRSCLNIIINKLKNLAIRALNPTPARGKYFVSNLDTIQTAPECLSAYLKEKRVRLIFGALDEA